MKIQTSNINHIPNIRIQPKVGGATCPHGAPAGACPVCSGMGGGGGGSSTVKLKPTPKELGLLTWADLLPAWNAMLAAKERKEFDQKLDNLNAQRKVLDQTNLLRTISSFIDSKINQVIKNLDSKVFTPVAKIISQTAQTLTNLVSDLKNQVMQNLQKLSGELNEKLQQMFDKLKNTTDKFKNAMEIFLSNIKDKEKAVKEYLIDFANRLRRKLFRVVEETGNSLPKKEWKPKTITRKTRKLRDSNFSIEEYNYDELNSEIIEELINV